MADNELIITRLFAAPRGLVFKTWTDAQDVAQWWGPQGFTITTQAMEVRPGGVWRYVMHGPDGTDYDNEIVYIEVVEPERLVYRHGSGEVDDPGEFQVTVTFTEQGNKTELTMRMVFQSAAARDQAVEAFGAIEGANQTLGRLADYLTQI
jgi:uncharacterized protein YndB with AHSA1/START domain